MGVNRSDLAMLMGWGSLVANSVGLRGITIPNNVYMIKGGMQLDARIDDRQEGKLIMCFNKRFLDMRVTPLEAGRYDSKLLIVTGQILGEYLYRVYLYPVFKGCKRDSLPFTVLSMDDFKYNFGVLFDNFSRMQQGIVNLKEHKELSAFIESVKRYKKGVKTSDGSSQSALCLARANDLKKVLNQSPKFDEFEKKILMDYITVLLTVKMGGRSSAEAMRLTKYIYDKANIVA